MYNEICFVYSDSEDEDESLVGSSESLLNTMQSIISGLDTSNAGIEESILSSLLMDLLQKD